MAAAPAPKYLWPLKRRSSYGLLPPFMSELRVVLLGNSWTERSSVGNFILGETRFSTDEEPNQCLRVRGQIEEDDIILINTPDLLNPNISEDKLRKHVELCVRLSDPGPHVFLLVLQPEGFTEEHRLRICRVLELFSDQSFDHSMVLISKPKKKRSHSCPPLQEMIRRCGFRSLRLEELKLPELLEKVKQILEETKGSHVICHRQSLKRPRSPNVDSDSSVDQPRKRSRSFDLLPPSMSDQKVKEYKDHVTCDVLKEPTSVPSVAHPEEGVSVGLDAAERTAHKLRIVLFGKNDDKKAALGNIIVGKKEFSVTRFKRDQEEQEKLRKLQEEYFQEKQRDEDQRREEDRIKQEQEERERKEKEKQYKKNMEEMKRKYEEEARKKAKMTNEFKDKYSKDFEALMEKHNEELKDLKKRHEVEIKQKEGEHSRKYNLLNKQSSYKQMQLKEQIMGLQKDRNRAVQEQTNLQDLVENLKKKQQQEIEDWKKKYKDKSYCPIC